MCAGFTTQCIFRKLQELGFSQAYAKDKNYRKFSKKIFALLFLPEHEMVATFHYYKTTIADMFQRYPQLSSFFDYVYGFWLKGNISMEMFCIFDRPPNLRLKHLYRSGNLSVQQYWDSVSHICRKL